jgi:hypothetical protein
LSSNALVGLSRLVHRPRVSAPQVSNTGSGSELLHGLGGENPGSKAQTASEYRESQNEPGTQRKKRFHVAILLQ